MAVNKVVVMGAGVMGRGISELISSTGCEVVLVEKSEEILKNSMHILSEIMDNEIEKWGLTRSEKKAILSRITPTTSLEEACDVRIVIESVPELASFGHHMGVGSSYGAFLAPLGHIAARLHAIGNQARQALEKGGCFIRCTWRRRSGSKTPRVHRSC